MGSGGAGAAANSAGTGGAAGMAGGGGVAAGAGGAKGGSGSASAGSGGGTGGAGSGGGMNAGSGGMSAGSGGMMNAGMGGSGGMSAGSGGMMNAGSGGMNAGSGGSAGMPPVIGDGGTVNATIIVRSGTTYDGQNKRFRAGSALGDGSQDEGQQPVFRVENGGRLMNVVLGSPAADGIHIYGDATLSNIVWEDIGEDAMTIKESGTVVLDGGSATNGEDKVFQINAPSTFRVSNFKASNAGKFIRQNGDTEFKVEVVIDRCDISQMDEAIFRTDSEVSTVTMTDTRYSNIGDALFVGVSAGNITQSGNTEY